MNEVSQLESQRDSAKQLVERRDLVLKLSNNREFKKLIREEFMVNECARFAQISADPALKAEERADALAISQSAGHLKRWLNIQIRMGDKAEADIIEIDQALEELRAEGEQGDETSTAIELAPGEELEG